MRTAPNCACILTPENTLRLTPERVLPGCGDMYQKLFDAHYKEERPDLAVISLEYFVTHRKLIANKVVLTDEEVAVYGDGVVHCFLESDGGGAALYLGARVSPVHREFYLYELTDSPAHIPFAMFPTLTNSHFKDAAPDEEFLSVYPRALLAMAAQKPSSKLQNLF